MVRLYGRTGRLTAQNGGFRPGQNLASDEAFKVYLTKCDTSVVKDQEKCINTAGATVSDALTAEVREECKTAAGSVCTYNLGDEASCTSATKGVDNQPCLFSAPVTGSCNDPLLTYLGPRNPICGDGMCDESTRTEVLACVPGNDRDAAAAEDGSPYFAAQASATVGALYGQSACVAADSTQVPPCR